MAQSWIFQVNPSRFDIEGFLATRPGPTRWLVTRNASKMKRGDEVFIWRAIAGGDPSEAGIIGRAVIISEPTEGTDDPSALKFWKSDEDRKSIKLRVGIRITSAATKNEILTRSSLIKDPILHSLSILHMANSTNYRLSPEEASRINQLWSKTDIAWAVSEAAIRPQRHWRMAMRAGIRGPSMWEQCFDLGVAAITYEGIEETDYSNLSLNEAASTWKVLKGTSQKYSIRSLAYDMSGGDVIYVRHDDHIVGKGIVRAPLGERAYAFNAASRRMVDENGTPWLQQVRVAWMDDFLPLKITVGSPPIYTIRELPPEDVSRLEGSESELQSQAAATPPENEQDNLLSTESYIRATPARMKIIRRHHNDLSNSFSKWVLENYGVKVVREKQQVDVRFALHGKNVLVELKVCFGIGTRHAIREALGQLFEYNYYPIRQPTDVWLLVLDSETEKSDRQYIDLLREKLSLPLYLGWRTDEGFDFHPGWP